jgi:hypothetical protein
MASVLPEFFADLTSMQAPATLDGGPDQAHVGVKPKL